MTDDPEAPLPAIERIASIRKSDWGARSTAEALALCDELHAALQSERSAHERTRAELAELSRRLMLALELISEYECQWGDDYLAKKWGLREQHEAIKEE